MKNKVMAYQLKDFIRKENKQNNKKPDDIGTKPVPKWLENKNNEIEQLFKETTNEDTEKYSKRNKMKTQNRNVKDKIEQLFKEAKNENTE
jgi:hypothetical protein